MHAIVEVGSRISAEADWPEGVALAMFLDEPARLTISLRRPHELEIQAVTAAPTQFAWIDGEHVAVLAYRLGPILSWAQTAYSPHLLPRERGRPGLGADPVVQIAMADHDTKTVVAAQHVRWPEEFAAAVRASVARMCAVPYSRIGYDHVLAGLHRRFPTTEDLIVDRADALCTATPVSSTP